MEITLEQTRERFSSLHTDELLNIKVSSELTKEDEKLLDAELAYRNVTEQDLKEAREIDFYLQSERKKLKDDFKNNFKRKFILLIILVIFAFGYSAFVSVFNKDRVSVFDKDR